MKKVIGTLALLVGISMALDAAAWAHRKTESGKSVRWQQREITLSLDPSLEMLGPMDSIESAVIAMIDLWSEQADLPMDFIVERKACGEPGYRQNGQNTNCLLADASFGRTGEDVGATTLLTFKGNSGGIVDGDIVFNAQRWSWAVAGQTTEPMARQGKSNGNGQGHDDEGQEPADVLSFEVVLTHELGHLLGLAHSELDDAIMYPTTRTGVITDVALAEDDVDGAVALYEGLEEELAAQEGGAGCQATPGQASPGSGLAALLLLGLLITARKLALAKFKACRGPYPLLRLSFSRRAPRGID